MNLHRAMHYAQSIWNETFVMLWRFWIMRDQRYLGSVGQVNEEEFNEPAFAEHFWRELRDVVRDEDARASTKPTELELHWTVSER